jgi:ABC-type antimicrobial peptide transport system permease subunit
VLLADSQYEEKQKQIQFVKTLESHLENSSGIGDVMISTALPGDYSLEAKIILEGQEYSQDTNISYPRANYISIMPDSLKKLGVALKKGRYFNSSDNSLDKNTALVSSEFANRHFENGAAIGKRFRLAQSESTKITWISIVGIVENTVQGNREGRGLPSVFRPFTQSPRKQITIAMRMKSNISTASITLRKTLQSIDPLLPSYKIETYTQSNERFTAPIKFISSLTALFGLAAVVLAASGIYGVMSNTINQRTQEIGIKRALGADEKTITKEFLTAGAKQLLWGGIPGVFAGCAMGFAMSQLFGTSNNALIIISISITTMIGSVVMLATYLPTKRALEMEPSDALHCE